MSDEALDSGLFAISLSESESESEQTQQSSAAPSRDRTGQTEEEFQAVKASYVAKVENGEIARTILLHLPLPLSAQKVTKQEAQEILHAVEELYFYKRYEEAVAFISMVLPSEGQGQGEGENEGENGDVLQVPAQKGLGLDEEVKSVLRRYKEMCVARMGP
ncbi:hypothetical protein BD289DRAFT_426958 [Coniella lustricola]|uniref:Uncharacterized protein n=1 Tax=Coniella lustricola TaxID=2025994 RepID=A0A2T3AFZ3_9PEZI|nr:hypothetical protein BD289DRAFT_426958 [Coniella lustricola]